MREIKFRAWDEKVMCYQPTLFKKDDNCQVALISLDEEMPLMQYTGLLDKNGTEIYEGDILRFASDECGNNQGYFSIQWDEQDVQFTGYGTPTDWAIHCEVIGNIYENPELLNE